MGVLRDAELYHNTGMLRALAAESPLSDLVALVCRLVMLGPQLHAGREHMLPGLIWSPHRGNRVKVNPDRRFANVLSPLALHQIACDEYISLSLCAFLSLSCTGWTGSVFAVGANNESLIREIILTILQLADSNNRIM